MILPLLIILLGSGCLATKDRRSSLQGAKFSELGHNGNYRHCVSSKDVSLLYTSKALDYDAVTPLLDVHVDEAEATVEFSLELFYLPRDAYYTVSVGTRCYNRPPLDRDAALDDVVERSAVWGHAPNALYRGAFDSPAQFGAYYVDPDSGWTAEASGCSHVVYRARFRLDELVTRCGVDYVAEGNGDVRVLASLVNVQLVELDATVRTTDWPAPFSVYVDSRDSLVAMYQLPSRPSAERVGVFAREISVDARNMLGLMVQTRQPKDDAVTLKLDSIFAHEHEPSFELDIDAQSDPPYVAEGDVVVQNWRLSSHGVSELFDGDYTLHFCSSRSDLCDQGRYDHAVRLLIRIANGDAGEHFSADSKLHSEIAQQLELHNEQRMYEGEYESGHRACMQTYVVGPQELTSKLHMELLEAFVCVDRQNEPTDRLACPGSAHAVTLVQTNATSPHQPRRGLNVTVHQPGAYGPMSVAVCFRVDGLFRDDSNVTVVRAEQRYETRVRIGAAQFRTASHYFDAAGRGASELLAGLEETDELGFADQIRSQSLQHGPFSRYRLAAALEAAQDEERVVEKHAHLFRVAPSEEYLHNVNDADAATGLGLIFLTLLCFICVVAVLCVLPRRRQTPEASTARAGSRRDNFYV